MSYGELAEARQIDRTSALKLALRRKWRKQADNHGTIRVFVPFDWATLADKRAAPGAVAGAEMSSAINALQSAITALTTRAEAADRRADQERDRADALRDRLAALQGELAAGQATAAEAEAAKIAQAEAEADTAELRQAEAARKARGLLARLSAAVRGE